MLEITNDVLMKLDMRLGTCSCCEHWSLKSSYGCIDADTGKCHRYKDRGAVNKITVGSFACEFYQARDNLE